MLLAFLTLLSGLSISASAVYYSVLGLAAIFAAARGPIVIMGITLEIGKLVTAWWLKANWHRAPISIKIYLTMATVVLMFITSMGIFGFLSKAHTDQNLVSGDVIAKISIYDEKIKTAKENIEANRRALKQMDEAVDQIMGRSSDEKGADKAVAIRRAQAKERARLIKEIEAEQKIIARLSEERAPIAAEVRKIEAEVGPIKYIAKLIYGDNPDANILEMAVVWVIIIIVFVFDPLAVLMLLAAQMSFQWAREEKLAARKAHDDGLVQDSRLPESIPGESGHTVPDTVETAVRSESVAHDGVVGETLRPQADNENVEQHPAVAESEVASVSESVEPESQQPVDHVVSDPEPDGIQPTHVDDEDIEDEDPLKEAKRLWKAANPNDSLKHQKWLLSQGKIDRLPWEPEDHNPSRVLGHGASFPTDVRRGDQFIRTDYLPSRVFKYTGTRWIEVDKKVIERLDYDDSYVNHLIEKISSGEYDPELLSESERTIIEERLNKDLQSGT